MIVDGHQVESIQNKAPPLPQSCGSLNPFSLVYSDLGTLVTPLLRSDNKIVKLSKWGEGYLFSLACAEKFIETVYELGINKHSDTWIRDNLDKVMATTIVYNLLVRPNRGNIYNSDFVENDRDFDYKASLNDSSPLLDRLGVSKLCREKLRLEADCSSGLLFHSRSDLNLSLVASRLEGKLQGFSC